MRYDTQQALITKMQQKSATKKKRARVAKFSMQLGADS